MIIGHTIDDHFLSRASEAKATGMMSVAFALPTRRKEE